MYSKQLQNTPWTDQLTGQRPGSNHKAAAVYDDDDNNLFSAHIMYS